MLMSTLPNLKMIKLLEMAQRAGACALQVSSAPQWVTKEGQLPSIVRCDLKTKEKI